MSANSPIPSLYQGVSQQPAALRALEQCEALENGYPSVADGSRKRPPTQFIKKLNALTPTNAKAYQYFRGDGEHNVIIIENGSLLVYDGVTGAAKTVDTTTFPGVLSYINSTNSIDDIGLLTVADTTFVWNRKKVVAMSAASIVAQVPMLFIYVKEGKPESSYKVSFIGIGVAVANTTSVASTYTTTAIAAALQTSINGLGGFTTTIDGNLITVRRTDNADFTFLTHDTSGSTMMSVFKNRVERYSDLPRTFVEGRTVEVRGQGDSAGKTAFWVTYKTATSAQIGHWEETVAPNVGEPTAFDATTMPHALVRQADGTFQFKRIAWDARLVGSTAQPTTPVPSCVGTTISDVFFYRNRLGMLADVNVLLSRANDLYNLWPKSAALVADDDPIDTTANSPKVSTLRHAVPFQRQLMLFSDTSQFPLTGGEVLSPRNVRADSATDFDCSATVRPVSSGQDLFFFYERAPSGTAYSGVREYFVNQSAVTNDAVDVTAHVPQYIPRNVHHAAVSSTEDLLLVLSKDQWNKVYFYKYLWSGDKKVQSAWGRWTFRPSDKILTVGLSKTTAYFVIQRSNGVYLEKMELQSTAVTPGLPFQVHLDSLTADEDYNLVARIYNVDLDETEIYPPSTLVVPAGEGEIVIVAGAFAGKSGGVLPIVAPVAYGWKVKGNWTNHLIPIWLGVRYEHRLTFSEQFMRDKDGVAIQQGRLQLKHMTIGFTKGVTFRAEVATPSRTTASYKYSAFQLGVFGTNVGSPVLRSGKWTFPVASRSDRATISLVNDSPYPATFHSAEWEGEFTTRHRRT